MLMRAGLLVLFATVCAAAGAADLELNSGRILKDAKIIAIGEATVTIISAGESVVVPVDDVPLDALALAHQALARKRERAKEVEASLAAREGARREQTERERREKSKMATPARTADPAKSPPAAIDPMVGAPRPVRVSQFQAVPTRTQQKKTEAKWSDGVRDYSVNHVTTLAVKIASDAGAKVNGECILEAIFIGKDRLGNYEVYSHESKDLNLKGPLENVVIASKPLADSVKHERDVLVQTKVRSGAQPYGWAVRLLQGNRVVAVTGSTDTMPRYFDKK